MVPINIVTIEKINQASPLIYFDQIADIHVSEIEEGFLSSLGNDFLKKFYKFIASSDSTFLYGAVADGKVHGFICGTTDINALYKKFILHSGFSVMWTLLPRLLSLRRIVGIVETLVYPQKKINQQFPASEILNFCVRKEGQRKGIGKSLFWELTKEFDRLGVEQIKIVTGCRQKIAQNFYESLKAKRICEIEVHKNVKSIVYVFDIISTTLPKSDV